MAGSLNGGLPPTTLLHAATGQAQHLPPGALCPG